MKKYSVWVVLLLAWSPWFLGALQVWNSGTFEASPANSDAISLGDDNIREFKENVRKRAQVELLWGTDIAGGETGRSREGAARGFYNTACPSVLSDSVTDTAGVAALGTGDDGRFCHDSDDDRLYVWSGTAWETALDTIENLTVTDTLTVSTSLTPTNISTGTNILGTTRLISTPRFASTGGIDAFNPLSFHIRSITTDITTDAVACVAGDLVIDTALASQVFGNAGDACLSVTLDLSTRTNATSRALVIGQFTMANNGGACGDGGSATSAHWAVYQDAIGTQLGPAINLGSTGTQTDIDNSPSTRVSFNYITNLSNASHEFAIHAEGDDSGCDYAPDTTSGNFLTVIDLGPAY